MLERRNTFRVLEPGRIIKYCQGLTPAACEYATLETLAGIREGPHRAFLVPKPFALDRDELTVCMQYLEALRVFDVVASLDRLAQVRPNEVAARHASHLRERLLRGALEDLATFQSDGVQGALRSRLGDLVVPYDYRGKLREATHYVAEALKLSVGASLYPELDALTEVLEEGASTLFRDASLKNQLLEIPGASVWSDSEQVRTGSRWRPSDIQWTDLRPIQDALRQLRDGPGDGLTVHNVDFETACALVCPEDDFAHIMSIEGVALPDDTIAKVLDSFHQDRERFYVCMAFRCLRWFARRLFYQRERPAVFQTRYRLETLSHSSRQAVRAVRWLDLNSQLPVKHLWRFLGGALAGLQKAPLWFQQG